jgi:ribosomal protein S27E
MNVEIRGRCPLCPSIGTVMSDTGYLICDGKRYFFPYRFYQCHRHGIFVWQGNKHKLFDMNKRMNEANRIENVEPEVAKRFEHMPTIADYNIVKFTCPNCGHKWEQYVGFFVNNEAVRCPFCGFEISR